jgi:hypothetical protein
MITAADRVSISRTTAWAQDFRLESGLLKGKYRNQETGKV